MSNPNRPHRLTAHQTASPTQPPLPSHPITAALPGSPSRPRKKKPPASPPSHHRHLRHLHDLHRPTCRFRRARCETDGVVGAEAVAAATSRRCHRRETWCSKTACCGSNVIGGGAEEGRSCELVREPGFVPSVYVRASGRFKNEIMPSA